MDHQPGPLKSNCTPVRTVPSSPVSSRAATTVPSWQLATAQAEATHAAVPLATLHAPLHAPQCDALVRVSTSQPLDALPSQSAKPVAHTRWQLRAAQTTRELGADAHPMPHAPQCARELRRSASRG
jgi:hypothetical protein